VKSNAKITLAVHETPLLAPHGGLASRLDLRDGFYAVFAMHLFEAIGARDVSGRGRFYWLRTLKHS